MSQAASQKAQAPAEITLTKPDQGAPAFAVDGRDGPLIKAGTIVVAPEFTRRFDDDTPVATPEQVPGTDYRIVVDIVGSPVAVPYDFDDPAAVVIGGFHYALGGNAPGGNAGGDAVPQINPRTLWDLTFRPAAADTRGMMLVVNSPGALHVPAFWRDIFFLNTDPDQHGTSRAGLPIANGRDTPKGHDNLNYHTSQEIFARHGKQLMSVEEYWASSYGVKERTAVGHRPLETGLDPDRTSMFGGMQDTGNLYCWVHDGHPDMPASMVIGYWADAANSGSRASYWVNLPSSSYSGIGARGRCDHLILG